ncbi:replication termination factor 2-like [Tiliqua scincoides]|uniref:replication termination factor 2-like n=1 Tax=Tiliqua scincoides TaxID=71010 RepID=UPI003461B9A7
MGLPPWSPGSSGTDVQRVVLCGCSPFRPELGVSLPLCTGADFRVGLPRCTPSTRRSGGSAAAARPAVQSLGGGGGTIPEGHELVEKVDKNAKLVAQWYYCTLSQEKLSRPIVACELGRLYNEDAIIEFLLDKSSYKVLVEAASHIKSIKRHGVFKGCPSVAYLLTRSLMPSLAAFTLFRKTHALP